MNDKPVSLRVYAPSPVAGKALAGALAARGMAAAYEGAAEEFRLMQGDEALELPCPARLGQALGRVQSWLAGGSSPQSLKCGGYTLDMAGKTWLAQGAEPVSLTDRETALLAALIRAEGHSLSRAAILSSVWEYHEDAETHTLETHIYRLRRKIEGDAANPAILLTDGAGYRLSGD